MVVGERAVHDGEGGVIKDGAALADADQGDGGDDTPVAPHGQVAGEGAVADGRGRGLIIQDGTAPAVAAAVAAEGLVAAEGAVADGQATGTIHDGAAVDLIAAAATFGLVMG